MVDINYKLYTAAQVRGIDNAAIHEFGVAGYELMCRAGAAILAAAQAHYSTEGHWLVVCGSGNNGGDGYVLATLALKAGLDVTVCTLSAPENLKGDAALAYNDWLAVGGKVVAWPLLENASYDLAFDAMLGTGIDRGVGGEFQQAIAYLNQLECPTVAIDIPSGLNADTGCVMGCAVEAQTTVTFVGRKRGMYTADGPDYCGRIIFDDLDIPAAAAAGFCNDGGDLLTDDFLAEVLSPRRRNSHKGSFGHVVAVGGIAGMSGAVKMCGEAALRSGAGRVTLVTDKAHANDINLTRPELMVKAVDAKGEWRSLLSADKIVAVGPGLGVADWSVVLFKACLDSGCPLVVDADGLNILASQSLCEPVTGQRWVLTPHPGEAARLLNCAVSNVQGDRVGSALAIARQYGACVVLKGCGTVVADVSGEYAICASGNPGMATAGSGDVLTGIIAALLGQGLSCFNAAQAGVLAHARAADLAAEALGEMAMVAGDIIDFLPCVWSSEGL